METIRIYECMQPSCPNKGDQVSLPSHKFFDADGKQIGGIEFWPTPTHVVCGAEMWCMAQ